MEQVLMKVIAEYEVESIVKLADLLGLTTRYEALSTEMNGYYYIDEFKNEIFVVINNELPKDTQLFVLAYLVAHHTLSSGTTICFADGNRNQIDYYLLALQILRATGQAVAAQKETYIVKLNSYIASTRSSL